MMRTQQTDKKR